MSSATVTLTDDDKGTTTPGDVDSAELSITGPTSNVSEGSNAEFTVTLSKQVAAEVSVGWTAPLGTDGAEAADLGATSGTVTFAANSAAGSTQTITIAVTDDSLSETAEIFTVTLGTITSTLSSQVTLKNGATSATATIAASDAITISITGPRPWTRVTPPACTPCPLSPSWGEAYGGPDGELWDVRWDGDSWDGLHGEVWHPDLHELLLRGHRRSRCRARRML